MSRHSGSIVACLSFAITLAAAPVRAAPAAVDWTAAERERGYVVFGHSPLVGMPSDTVPSRETLTAALSCALAQGEYESVQFGVHGLDSELRNIRVTVTSDLDVTVYRRRAEFTVPAAPEATAADADKRVARPSDWMYLQRGNIVETLPAGLSVNFWLTIRAAASAAPGVHDGTIRIELDDRPATELDLAVSVHAFELAPARIPFGMYYSRGHYSPNRGPDASHAFVYRDMAAHSQNAVSFSVSRDFGSADFAKVPLPADHSMQRIIGTAIEAGLVSPHFPCLLVSSSLYNEYREDRTNLTPAQLRAAIAWLHTQRREHDWPEIIVYGHDEPPVPAPGLREFYSVLRSLPIRLGTAMSAKAAYAYGDIHDVWIVHDGHITPEMQAEAARRGAQVWTYTYRLWRQSYKPLIQRFYAGLYTWALRLGGNYVWEYYYGYNWVDPDTNETMPTTGWEARRDGVDDYRYLQMVEDAVRARADEPAARDAAVWLAELRARVLCNFDQDLDGYWGSHARFPAAAARVEPHLVDAGTPFAVAEYDKIRATAAAHIVKLGPASPALAEPGPIPAIRDEAAPFRGRSVADCITSLRDADAATRRAAAWALFELGAQAAAAVPELTAALDDPDVRIPAMKALEAIGAPAAAAAPRVAELLSHPDDFLRQGAALTLTGLKTVPTKLLLEMPEMWRFRRDPAESGEAENWFLPATAKQAPDWTPMSTHAFWQPTYVGDGWYALDLVIPDPGAKRVWIRFGAVDENYTLWINGRYIDDDLAAGTGLWNVPVEAEITGRFKPGESNHIVVRVHNVASAGGIWKPVALFVEE